MLISSLDATAINISASSPPPAAIRQGVRLSLRWFECLGAFSIRSGAVDIHRVISESLQSETQPVSATHLARARISIFTVSLPFGHARLFPHAIIEAIGEWLGWQ